MQAKGFYRKKQESVKVLFGWSDTLKSSGARPMKFDYGYYYQPSCAIDIPATLTPSIDTHRLQLIKPTTSKLWLQNEQFHAYYSLLCSM